MGSNTANGCAIRIRILKNAETEGAAIVFEDEASFRQTPTLHATWARRGGQPRIPTRGERNTQKIFGAVRPDNANFIHLHQRDYFQWETYPAFLEQVVAEAAAIGYGGVTVVAQAGGWSRGTVTRGLAEWKAAPSWSAVGEFGGKARDGSGRLIKMRL